MKTIQQFRSEAKQLGFNRVRQFVNISNFMNFCYRGKLTQENSITYIKPDGSGCYLAY